MSRLVGDGSLRDRGDPQSRPWLVHPPTRRSKTPPVFGNGRHSIYSVVPRLALHVKLPFMLPALFARGIYARCIPSLRRQLSRGRALPVAARFVPRRSLSLSARSSNLERFTCRDPYWLAGCSYMQGKLGPNFKAIASTAPPKPLVIIDDVGRYH